MSFKSRFAFGLVAAAGLATAAWAIDPPTNIMQIDRAKAKTTFDAKCASCHDHPNDRIPSREAISGTGPDNIVRALSEGVMKPMAAGLSNADIEGVAVYLTGTMPLPRAPAGPDSQPLTTANSKANTNASPWPMVAATRVARV